MDPRHLRELVELEDAYWWHVAKRQLVTSVLRRHFPPPGRLVEGGIGSAGNLLSFREFGYDVTGFDLMTASVEHARRRGLDDVHEQDLTEPWPLEPNSLRAVVLLDVLEHLPDPVRVLRHAADALAPGGGVVLTVPACPWLYGSWDRRLGHYRRYTARELRTQAARAGLRVKWLTHWNAFSLPAAIAVRGWDRLARRGGHAPTGSGGEEAPPVTGAGADDPAPTFPRVSPAMNSLLLGCARWERWWLMRAGVPFGLSLVGVLCK